MLCPSGTSWKHLQSGAGYNVDTMETCPIIGKLVLQFQRPNSVQEARLSPIQKTVFNSGSMSVNLETRAVQSGPGLLAMPCASTEDVWRQLECFQESSSKYRIVDKRRVPYCRLAIAVLFAKDSEQPLKPIQMSLLAKVR